MKRADVNVHINAEEHAASNGSCPGARHELVYPAVAPVALGAEAGNRHRGQRSLIANFLGLRWFLRESLPLAGWCDIEIYGNIDEGVKNRATRRSTRLISAFSKGARRT